MHFNSTRMLRSTVNSFLEHSSILVRPSRLSHSQFTTSYISDLQSSASVATPLTSSELVVHALSSKATSMFQSKFPASKFGINLWLWRTSRSLSSSGLMFSVRIMQTVSSAVRIQFGLWRLSAKCSTKRDLPTNRSSASSELSCLLSLQSTSNHSVMQQSRCEYPLLFCLRVISAWSQSTRCFSTRVAPCFRVCVLSPVVHLSSRV